MTKTKYKTILFTALALFAPATFLFAQTSALRSFKEFSELNLPDSKTAQVYELVFKDAHKQFFVYDKSANIFIPSLKLSSSQKIPAFVVSSTSRADANAVLDGDLSTSVEFEVDGNSMARSEIVFEFKEPVKVNGLKLYLSKNVALPNKIMVYDITNAKIVLAPKAIDSDTILFPETKTRQLAVRFEHMQPLVISEIDFLGDTKKDVGVKLRFLRQPGHSYTLYTNQAYFVPIKMQEMPDLRSDKDLRIIALDNIKWQSNPLFVEPDSDGDGVIDKFDNCVNIANSDQKDINQNGRGDACDDFDKDGVLNIYDNCPNTPNAKQLDEDKDGKGDVCDSEESRFTEKYPWILWLGVFSVFALFVAVFAVLAKRNPELLKPENKDNTNS